MKKHLVLGAATAALAACGVSEVDRSSSARDKSSSVPDAMVEPAAVSAALTSAPTEWIYQGALVGPWEDWSWAPHSLANTVPAAEGTNSIAATMGPWQALYFAHPGFSTAGHSTFSLWVNGGVSGGGVALRVSANVGGLWLPGTGLGPACAGGAVRANTWLRCDIALSAIAPDGATIGGIAIQEDSGTTLPTLYFHSLGFDVPSAATPDGGPPPPAGIADCRRMSVQNGVSVNGYASDVYNWYDANCLPRSATLVRNDAVDPGGGHGGYLRQLSYQVDGQTRQCAGPSGTRYEGWGYSVNHYAAGSRSSHDVAGNYRTVLNGTHHSIHEFKVRLSPGGPVDLTVHWFFATGRTNPVYAITHDATPAGPDVVAADSRSPYGNLIFEGIANGNGPVAGIGWGDQYRFTTTGSGPVTFASAWDYRGGNAVPYTVMWSAATDAEMGAVQTQTFDAHVSGGDYGGGLLADCWGRTSASPGSCLLQPAGALLRDWLWPFQLNQYELPFVTNSKRMAWGSSLGAVGQTAYSSFRRSLSGYPYQSYSVILVLGKRSDQPTAAQVAEIEVAAASTLSATVGSVPASGPGGVGRADRVPYQPAGYDSTYGVWVVNAASSGSATFRLEPGLGALLHPIFRIEGWTAAGPPAAVSLGGAAIAEGIDYFATVDPARGALWLTLNRRISSRAELSVQP
jgi:hypothetical protein